MPDQEVHERVAAAERALAELDGLAAPARETALAAVAALVDLYGEGLARVLDRCGPEVAGDELIGHLLLAHGMHPVPVEERVRAALEEVMPYLQSHGGGVDLVGVGDGVARVALRGTCDGCPASATTLKLAVEEAVLRAAPDIERVEADPGEPPATSGPLLTLECVPGALAK
jgi:Fe-S cluster biogenesis protein NfuA